MKRNMKKLSDEELSYLEGQFGALEFNSACDLVYEDQIPNTGIVLLNGEAVLTRKKRIIDSIERGSLYGLYELLNNEPVRHGCKVQGNARVILLQKSDLMDLSKEDSPLSKILS
jgi:signal-transduction protein with cAMP-binding, CBS, and nucleotidyltransferase domain